MGWAFNQDDWHLHKKQTQRQTCRENTLGGQAEAGVMLPQAEHCLGPPEPGKGLGGSSPRGFRESGLALPTP